MPALTPSSKFMLMVAMAASASVGAGASLSSGVYPERSIALVVPFAAGTASDRIARDLADALRKPLGQSVIVENMPGAGGTLGASKVAVSAPDGYTLLLHHIGMATASALYRNLSFRPLDFEPLGLVSELPMTLIGKPGLPAANFVELDKWLQANRGNVNLAHAGLGSASYLCGLLFQSSLKLTLATVPYKAAGPAMNDLHGGQVDLMCDQSTDTEAQIEGGLVKAYAVTSRRRLASPGLATLPTLDESGLKGFSVTIWHGLYAPKGTPPAIADRLNAALRDALRDPEFLQREEALGAEIVNDDRNTRAGHRRFLEAEIARWTPIIRAAGPYAD